MAETPERPRLLLVVTLAETGGAQTYMTTLLPAISELFDTTVAAHVPGPVADAARATGVPFVELRHVRRPLSPWRDPLGLLELVALMRRVRPHVVHANSAKAGVLARLAAGATRVPIRIYTVHGWAFLAHDGVTAAVYRWAERAVRPLTTVAICVAESEKRAGIAAGVCDPRTTVVIRNGVDSGKSRPPEVRNGPPRIVSVGRLQAPKDPLTLVRALGSLRGTPFEADIVGEGPLRPTVELELERLGLDASVRLLGERRDVTSLLARSDVFVLVSRSEGLPLSVLEAMAVGLPVVASRVGGIPEVVVDGETGLLVLAEDAEQLAAALDRLLNDDALRRRLGEAGRTRVREHFDLDSVRRAHIDLYRRELAKRGLPAPSP
jgi:glycosyltransferase involved in cell wall biosynthesis